MVNRGISLVHQPNTIIRDGDGQFIAHDLYFQFNETVGYPVQTVLNAVFNKGL
jgi:hypothetical protein